VEQGGEIDEQPAAESGAPKSAKKKKKKSKKKSKERRTSNNPFIQAAFEVHHLFYFVFTWVIVIPPLHWKSTTF
jgi:hypothetical protein